MEVCDGSLRWKSAGANQPQPTFASPAPGGGSIPWERPRSPGHLLQPSKQHTQHTFFLHRERILRLSFLGFFFLPETLRATLDPSTSTHVQHALNPSPLADRLRVQFDAILARTGPISLVQHLLPENTTQTPGPVPHVPPPPNPNTLHHPHHPRHPPLLHHHFHRHLHHHHHHLDHR